MIKLIAFDMDDTLLNSNREFNKEDKDELIKLIQKGVYVNFVTGRPYTKTIDDYYHELGIYNGYYVAFNGEAIYDINSHKCIYSDNLEKSDLEYIEENTRFVSQYKNVARYIYKDVNDEGYYSFVYTTLINKYVHIEDLNNHIKIKVVNDFNSFDCAHKFMIASDPETIQEIYKLIPKEMFSKYSICISMPCFIEFFKKGNNKYLGLKKVMDILNIKENEVMAFGDSMNDYELVTKAHIGVAMGNSISKLKSDADYVTLDNNNLGIKLALKHFEKEF